MLQYIGKRWIIGSIGHRLWYGVRVDVFDVQSKAKERKGKERKGKERDQLLYKKGERGKKSWQAEGKGGLRGKALPFGFSKVKSSQVNI